MRTVYNNIIIVLQAGRLLGPDRKCEAYPCHFDGLDCTWCFCLFYLCNDESTGDRLTRSGWTGEIVWSCQNCSRIHKSDVAGRVLSELLSVTRNINEVPQEKLAEIRLKIRKEG